MGFRVPIPPRPFLTNDRDPEYDAATTARLLAAPIQDAEIEAWIADGTARTLIEHVLLRRGGAMIAGRLATGQLRRSAPPAPPPCPEIR
jgi:hypothetical protein